MRKRHASQYANFGSLRQEQATCRIWILFNFSLQSGQGKKRNTIHEKETCCINLLYNESHQQTYYALEWGYPDDIWKSLEINC